MKKILGTCSLCGGRVSIATVFMSVNPPVPCCEQCGAHPKDPHGAVIDMEPKKFSDPSEWGDCYAGLVLREAQSKYQAAAAAPTTTSPPTTHGHSGPPSFRYVRAVLL